MTWEQLLIELLTKGWPASAIVIALMLRKPLERMVDRVTSAELGPLKVKTPTEVLGEGKSSEPSPRSLPEAPSKVLPDAPTKALPESGGSDTEKVPNVDPADDPWRKCGNIYWLGNNTIFVGLAVATGNINGARTELINAIHHAKQLPIDSAYADTLTALLPQLSDPSARQFVVSTLVQVGSRIGKYIADQQRDFGGKRPALAQGK